MKSHLAIFAYALGQCTSLANHEEVRRELMQRGLTGNDISNFISNANKLAESFYRPAGPTIKKDGIIHEIDGNANDPEGSHG